MSVSMKSRKTMMLPAEEVRCILEAAGYGADLRKGTLHKAENPESWFRNHPLEILRSIRFAVQYDLEMEYPLLVEKYALSENSGGAGKYRGGMGIVRTIRILEESGDSMLVSAATERSVSKPWGLNGGQGGGNASIKVYRDGKLIEKHNYLLD